MQQLKNPCSFHNPDGFDTAGEQLLQGNPVTGLQFHRQSTVLPFFHGPIESGLHVSTSSFGYVGITRARH